MVHRSSFEVDTPISLALLNRSIMLVSSALCRLSLVASWVLAGFTGSFLLPVFGCLLELLVGIASTFGAWMSRRVA